VAGQFYSAERNELITQIEGCFRDRRLGPGIEIPKAQGLSERADDETGRIECFIVPHAGYLYSGPVAAHAYAAAYKNLISRAERFKVIILGPNHYGVGSGIALSPSDSWETPLGSVFIDHDLSKEISDASEIIDTNALAHLHEHSVEVQLPFLQTIMGKSEYSIVPISLMLQDQESSREVSEALSAVIRSKRRSNYNFLIIGSSDLTHYESQTKANFQDNKLLEKVKDLDVVSYYSTLERNSISACGYGAIAAVMGVARALGKKKGIVLKYATSGDTTGETSSVVGYSAVHFV
jgi:AmmeMemoRadiSam system protein B